MLLGLALCRGSMAEQSAAREIPCRVSSTLEKKALLLQRQLQHQVRRENEIPSRAVEVPAISHTGLHTAVETRFCTFLTESAFAWLPGITASSVGGFGNVSVTPRGNLSCFLQGKMQTGYLYEEAQEACEVILTKE